MPAWSQACNQSWRMRCSSCDRLWPFQRTRFINIRVVTHVRNWMRVLFSVVCACVVCLSEHACTTGNIYSLHSSIPIICHCQFVRAGGHARHACDFRAIMPSRRAAPPWHDLAKFDSVRPSVVHLARPPSSLKFASSSHMFHPALPRSPFLSFYYYFIILLLFSQ